MDRVYEAIYNPNETKEVNFVDMGHQSGFDTIAEFAYFSIVMCDGQVKSNGWKQLENYPNDFKVTKSHQN